MPARGTASGRPLGTRAAWKWTPGPIQAEGRNNPASVLWILSANRGKQRIRQLLGSLPVKSFLGGRAGGGSIGSGWFRRANGELRSLDGAPGTA